MSDSIHVPGMGIFTRKFLYDEIDRFCMAFDDSIGDGNWDGALTVVDSSAFRAYLTAMRDVDKNDEERGK